MIRRAHGKPRLVALYSSVMQSGKTSVANYLASCHGYRIVSFATPLKKMVYALLVETGMEAPEAEDRVWGDRKEEPIPALGGVTARYLMQTIGTEWGRDTVSRELWVMAAMSQVETLISAGECVVIDDMRFPNEFDAVCTETGVVVRVARPGGRSLSGKHGSEGQLDDEQFDLVLSNDGSLVDLLHKARVWMSMYPASN